MQQKQQKFYTIPDLTKFLKYRQTWPNLAFAFNSLKPRMYLLSDRSKVSFPFKACDSVFLWIPHLACLGRLCLRLHLGSPKENAHPFPFCIWRESSSCAGQVTRHLLSEAFCSLAYFRVDLFSFLGLYPKCILYIFFNAGIACSFPSGCLAHNRHLISERKLGNCYSF